MKDFWTCVDVRGHDDCWEWQVVRNPHGYGRFHIGGKQTQQAHRVAWMITRGSIPKNICVLHRCDNPPCCNPAHLFLGTQEDNMKDMGVKGRATPLPGEANGRAKLTTEQVREIRDRYAAGGETHRSLAAEFDVDHASIGYIIRREHWKHLS